MTAIMPSATITSAASTSIRVKPPLECRVDRGSVLMRHPPQREAATSVPLPPTHDFLAVVLLADRRLGVRRRATEPPHHRVRFAARTGRFHRSTSRSPAEGARRVPSSLCPRLLRLPRCPRARSVSAAAAAIRFLALRATRESAALPAAYAVRIRRRSRWGARYCVADRNARTRKRRPRCRSRYRCPAARLPRAPAAAAPRRVATRLPTRDLGPVDSSTA